jgi:hypothetical protein
MNKDELATEVFASVAAWLERRTVPITDRQNIMEDNVKMMDYRLGIVARDIKKVAADLEHHLQRIREDIERLKEDDRDRIELP